jgi:hypothetical protein
MYTPAVANRPTHTPHKIDMSFEDALKRGLKAKPVHKKKAKKLR